MRHALVEIAAADLRDRGGWVETRRRELDGVQGDPTLHVSRREAELLASTGGDGLDLLVGRLLVLEAPAPVLAGPERRGGLSWPRHRMKLPRRCLLGSGLDPEALCSGGAAVGVDFHEVGCVRLEVL